MEITVICPKCAWENMGSKLNCEKCQTSLVGVPRKSSALANKILLQKNEPAKITEIVKTESVGQALWRSLRSALIAVLAVSIFTALICWLGNWRTASNFGNGLIYTGIVIVFIGYYIFRGNQRLAESHLDPYNPLNMQGSLANRTRQGWLDLMKGLSNGLVVAGVGILCIMLGWLIIAVMD